ncbi:MAG: hypothetical protein ACJ8AT_21850 [Hyalangium sp.]|uniref:hypothetical protein n=1 Tax=Hyalangium sp. TaxID=2028555 RepID=UPI0038999DB1
MKRSEMVALVDMDGPEYIQRWLTWRPRGLVITPAQLWEPKPQPTPEDAASESEG